ncbi:glycosyltransferase family 2 protein [Bizionia paragorgiae]|uniref:Glycosyltransferase involved in cell wall bisynthesis n=1 Tax=Bizionia paragorgiae TaxID=283786 RepID=A0A1H4BBX9_BIZPA|nr:glycosyltransferase family 2 protein [Bizionia paragorgiae]SEA45554.1 Glycosyltransferase involved in cell wall bisynthesis [Bizionia paragorgiae]
MVSITVFTPTFNRAHLLSQLYESLCDQTLKDFQWLIVDDGSVDNSKEVIDSWIAEGVLNIRYIFQENQGMVAAHNTAHYNMTTDLCVCIDSDDYMPINGIERMLDLWKKYASDECAGIIGLDAYSSGAIVGDKFPKTNWECKFSELESNNITGDKKFVHNRKIFNKFLPYPKFENEKFPITSYLYFFIEQEHKYLGFNEVFCIVEYQEDGLSNNIINQYKESPNSFAHYRKARIRFAINYKLKIKNTIHYISSMLMAKRYRIVSESPAKLLTLVLFPFGIGMYLYLKNTKRTSLNKDLNKIKN